MSTTLLILGASGDLTSRRLIRAFAQLLHRESHVDLDLGGAGNDGWRSVVRQPFGGDAPFALRHETLGLELGERIGRDHPQRHGEPHHRNIRQPHTQEEMS